MIFVTMIVALILGCLGEIACKRASSGGFWAPYYQLAACICWGVIGPFIWIHVYKTYKLSTMAVTYNLFQVIILCVVGVVLFKEPLTARLVIGAALAVIAIYIMQS